MTPTIAGIQKLFEFFGMIGQGIRYLFRQKVDISGHAALQVTIQLDPQLESLIREILVERNLPEEPALYWERAMRGIVSRSEAKFRALSDLDITDVALGTEAMAQDRDLVPQELQVLALRYVERYVLTAQAQEVTEWVLPASSLAETFRNASKEFASSFTDRLRLPRVKPKFDNTD